MISLTERGDKSMGTELQLTSDVRRVIDSFVLNCFRDGAYAFASE
jgi:hypothetical protein